MCTSHPCQIYNNNIVKQALFWTLRCLALYYGMRVYVDINYASLVSAEFDCPYEHRLYTVVHR